MNRKQSALYGQRGIEGSRLIIVILKVMPDFQQAAGRILLPLIQKVRIEGDAFRCGRIGILYVIRSKAYKHTASVGLGVQALAAFYAGVRAQALARLRSRNRPCNLSCCRIVVQQYQHRAGGKLRSGSLYSLRLRLEFQPAHSA